MTKTIVLIDDDITALDIVSYLFEERGFTVERFADGREAIAHLRESTPDVIVVDLMMPHINGVQTVSELRALGITVPIIAFTAVDEPELHRQAEAAGCDMVLTKPCRPEKLLDHIKRLLPDA